MRFSTTTAIVGLTLFSIWGCSSPKDAGTGDTANATGGATPGKPGDGKGLHIAVIPKGSTHEFWKSVHEGADKAGAELGVTIDWKGPLNENDRDNQIKVVEDFVNKKVDGIVLAPLDDTALRAPVKDATDAKIPVVIIDSALKDAQTVSFVATDNEKGGNMAGAELGRLLNGKGRVVMLRYEVGSASTDSREKGFLDAIAKFPGITVVVKDQYGHTTTETAQKASENMLSPLKKPDGSLNVDGIYCPNESTTFGMLLTLQSNKWAGKVKFVGFDASTKLIDGLKSGEIDGLIVQNPRNMGYLGVKTIVASIKGEKVEARIDTGATLVTKATMADPKVAELLAPPKN